MCEVLVQVLLDVAAKHYLAKSSTESESKIGNSYKVNLVGNEPVSLVNKFEAFVQVFS